MRQQRRREKRDDQVYNLTRRCQRSMSRCDNWWRGKSSIRFWCIKCAIWERWWFRSNPPFWWIVMMIMRIRGAWKILLIELIIVVNCWWRSSMHISFAVLIRGVRCWMMSNLLIWHVWSNLIFALVSPFRWSLRYITGTVYWILRRIFWLRFLVHWKYIWWLCGDLRWWVHLNVAKFILQPLSVPYHFVCDTDYPTEHWDSPIHRCLIGTTCRIQYTICIFKGSLHIQYSITALSNIIRLIQWVFNAQ